VEKLRIMTVVGTRPEIIRLSCVIKRLDEALAVEHTLVHTGQNYDYELNGIFFEDLKLRKPDYFLAAEDESALKTVGNILSKMEKVLSVIRPDAFLVLGDTNSTLCAIAAKRMHIPVFHMEAGNRCFDQRVPEEINRKIVDHVSDINMTYSDLAREHLIKEGFPADRVIKTGSPMYEVLKAQADDIEKSDVLLSFDLPNDGFFVVSSHREENINSESFFDLTDSLNAIAMKYEIPVIVSTHPRTRKRIEESNEKLSPLIVLSKPLGFHDYVKLELNAKAVLSDSGTISEESSILGFPALNIRQTHERPEAMEEAAVIMTGLKKDRILQGLSVLAARPKGAVQQVKDYCVPNVSEKVLRIILSYTDYVNRTVWQSFTGGSL
jgi:UDP-N-acetylglucosamine 2-epimerase